MQKNHLQFILFLEIKILFIPVENLSIKVWHTNFQYFRCTERVYDTLIPHKKPDTLRPNSIATSQDTRDNK